MSNQIDELMESGTLAPIKESFYQPVNLSSHDSNILGQIAQTSIRNIETTAGALTHLESNLKMYKSCMIDAINLQAELADIITKYAKDPPKQSYTLPGVISIPSSYDLGSIKSDNERLEQIKDMTDKITAQKQLYMRLMQQDFKIFLENYKRTCYSDSSFEEWINSLNMNINPAY